MSRLIFNQVGTTPSDTDSGSGQVYLKGDVLCFKRSDNQETNFIEMSGGMVGIGTTAPVQKLHVEGTIIANNEVHLTTTGSVRLISTGNDLRLDAGSSEKVRVKSDGNVGIGTTTPQGLLHIKHATNSTQLSANHIFGLSTGGISISAVPVAKAWVNFDGTGTLAVNDSYNVSGVTDNGSGDYTINFATAMSNANYCPVFGHWTGDGNGNNTYQKQGVALAVGSIRVSANNISVGDADSQGNYVVIFGA